MAEIRLEHVKKIYPGGVVALQDFSLHIQDGEFVALVGPSGCGKSTLLRMIAGLEPLSTGRLKIDGQVVNQTPAKERDLAMVFQDFALYPHMTVYQNIAFPLLLRHVERGEVDNRVRDMAERMGIPHLLNRKPGALSVGQRQRAALGRALVRRPGILLLDEPLSNLDAALRQQMRAEIARLHRVLGATFVYVTHDQAEAITLADRIVVMKDGIIQQTAAPMQIYQYPQNRFVAGFIGSPPMNFLSAVLLRETDGYAVEILGRQLYLPDSIYEEPLLSCYVGQKVTLGIRPEHLSCWPVAPDAVALAAIIEFCEPLGAEALLHCRCAEIRLTVCVPSDFRPDTDTQTIWLSAAYCYLFARDSQRTIFNGFSRKERIS